MPDFFVSAATGALSPVLQKLAALLSDEYKRFKRVRGEVKFLIQELKAMHAFLLKKSEEENPDAQDKAWMMEVRELSYDIEDSLDDFMVRVDDKSAKPDGFIDKCKNLLAKTKSRYRIAKAIQDLKAQVKEVSERNARYRNSGETVINTSNEAVDPRALAIFEDASRLVGIDKPKQEVISFLTKEDVGILSQQLKIVSIVGIGGIGKTTLAKQVYEELKDQFECHAFLSVSRNPDMLMILRTILFQVNGERYCDTEAGSIQQLIEVINKFLQMKRYLIVVDDVWDVKTWDTIKYALSSNSCGSVIITTTRIHDVAKACCSLYSDGWVYKPNPLGEDDSKRLLQNRIFGPGNECPKHLKQVSDKILKKCGGLPLAIIAISGLLASKARNGVHSVTEWDHVQSSIGHGLERDATVEAMLGILSLSYFDLPYHLKACLLYFSIFPEDCYILKDRVVRLWVAEGFIPSESTCTLYESGEKSFIELLNRSLILPWGIHPWTGEVDGCRVHDTILDFIVCKSTEENFVTVVDDGGLRPPPPGIKFRRLSMQGGETAGDAALDSDQKYANVRSIISFGSHCSLLGFRLLRVLDFEDCWSLQNHHLANIGLLFQLRYLSLNRTSLTEIPEQIRELQHLETLDILYSMISKIPTAIFRLKRLVNLLMGPMWPSCLPGGGIKNLQALEHLSLEVLLEEKEETICVEEIGELNKLRDLQIGLPDYVDSEASYLEFTKKLVSSIHRLNKLQNVTVVSTYDEVTDMTCSNMTCSLEGPWPCSSSLRKLNFTPIVIPRVPSGMKSLVNIQELLLSLRILDQESLCVLGGLPVLIFLQLSLATKNEDIRSFERLTVSRRCGFISLMSLNINFRTFSRPSMPMLTFEAESMPKLEDLNIDFDAYVTISVTIGCLNFGLKHLSQLKKFRCGIYRRSGPNYFLRVKAVIEEELGNHPNRPHFSARHNEYEYFDIDSLYGETSFFSPSPSPSDDDADPWLSTAVLPLPTDLSFTMDHDGTRHGQQGRRVKTRPGKPRRALPCSTNISGGGRLVQGVAADSVKGTSDAGGPTCGVLEPALIAVPEEQALAPPCFTFSYRSSDNAVAEQQAPIAQSPALSSWDLNAFSSVFDSLSLCNDVPGPGFTAMAVEGASHTDDKTSSSDSAWHENAEPQLSTAVLTIDIDHHGALGTRRGQQQQRRRSKTRKAIARRALPSSTTISGRGGLVQGVAHSVKGSSVAKGGGPACGFLEPRPISTTQKQAFMPPDFTLSAGSSSVVAEPELQAPVAQSPALSSWDLNAFSGAVNSLSLQSDDLGSTATVVERASHTGAPTSHGLGPGLIADPQQTSTPCFTFNAGSSNPEK